MQCGVGWLGPHRYIGTTRGLHLKEKTLYHGNIDMMKQRSCEVCVQFDTAGKVGKNTAKIG